jgi:hypothetical protein
MQNPKDSEALQSLLQNLVSIRRNSAPVSMSTFDKPITSGFDRIGSIEGLDEISRTIDRFTPSRTSEIIAIKEIKLWMQREYDQAALDRENPANRTLQTIALGILPFIIFENFEPDRWHNDLNARLSAIVEILENTAFTGGLSFKAKAKAIRSGIELWLAQDTRTELHRSLLEKLIAQLRLIEYPASSGNLQSMGTKAVTIDISRYLKNIGGPCVEEARELIEQSIIYTLEMTNPLVRHPAFSDLEKRYDMYSTEEYINYLTDTILGVTNLSSQVNNSHFIAKPIPALFEVFCQDGIFLRNWAPPGHRYGNTVLLPDFILNRNILSPKSRRNAINKFAIHELIPGHALHLSASSKTAYSGIFSFQRCPVTFEGWASWIESLQAVVEGGHQILDDIKFTRLRRLLPSYMVLFDSRFTPSDVLTHFESIDRITAEKLIPFLTANYGVSMLSYGVGISVMDRLIGDGAKALIRLDRDCWSCTLGILSRGPISVDSVKVNMDDSPNSRNGRV